VNHKIVSEILILLRPDYLFRSYQVSKSKDKVCTVFNLLQQALDETSDQHALSILNQAIEILGPVEVIETAEILPTNTSLEQWEIDDFDQFFALKHVQAKDPPECLVASVLTAYRALLELNYSTSLESAKLEVESQKVGFKSCANLFVRVFNLRLGERL
jgi:hypothetical protein